MTEPLTDSCLRNMRQNTLQIVYCLPSALRHHSGITVKQRSKLFIFENHKRRRKKNARTQISLAFKVKMSLRCAKQWHPSVFAYTLIIHICFGSIDHSTVLNTWYMMLMPKLMLMLMPKLMLMPIMIWIAWIAWMNAYYLGCTRFHQNRSDAYGVNNVLCVLCVVGELIVSVQQKLYKYSSTQIIA